MDRVVTSIFLGLIQLVISSILGQLLFGCAIDGDVKLKKK